jgi:drug/metabolite transporter (DMT)-like permease
LENAVQQKLMKYFQSLKSWNLALVQLHVAVFFWGFTGVLGKAISVDEYALVCYRIFFTCIIFSIILWFNKSFKVLSLYEYVRIGIIGSVIAIHWVFLYGSIKYAGPTVALLCLSTSGIFSALLEPLVNKTKLIWVELLIGCIAFIGMMIIYKFEIKLGLGIIFGVLAALLSVVFTIMNKKIADKYNSTLLLNYELFFGLLVLLVIAPLYYSYFPQLHNIPKDLDWLWLLLLSGVCTVAGQTLAMKALRKLSSFTVILSVNLEPIYGMFWAYIFFNDMEGVSNGFYYGVILIFASVALHALWSFYQTKKVVVN